MTGIAVYHVEYSSLVTTLRSHAHQARQFSLGKPMLLCHSVWECWVTKVNGKCWIHLQHD
ncbi:hypothetical protein QQ045_014828 [Rhodiola kirilowii]